MGVSLARKGKLELKETKEMWASQVRAVLVCWCSLGSWVPALGNCVYSALTESRAILCLLASQGHRCGPFHLGKQGPECKSKEQCKRGNNVMPGTIGGN